MTKRECLRCKKIIDTEVDLYVTLGTHEKGNIVEMAYFHFNCWRLHFEEKARAKAEAVVNGMQERMMPLAKQMTDKLKQAIGSGGEKVFDLK